MESCKLDVEGIIFDLDGTIVDSTQAYVDAARTAFSAFGKEKFHTRIALEIPRRFELNIPLTDLVKGIDEKEFREIYLNAYYRATRTKTKPFPKVELTLETLSRKAKLALTTRRQVSANEIKAQLEKFGFVNYFQAVVTAVDTANPKPSPEAIIQCARRLGLKPSFCVVVGDSVVDVRAGKNAGTQTVAVLSGIFSRKELQREDPDLILDSVKKLPDLIK
jgi:HAD superfamily hydrolase (TIGR01509 family)